MMQLAAPMPPMQLNSLRSREFGICLLAPIVIGMDGVFEFFVIDYLLKY